MKEKAATVNARTIHAAIMNRHNAVESTGGCVAHNDLSDRLADCFVVGFDVFMVSTVFARHSTVVLGQSGTAFPVW